MADGECLRSGWWMGGCKFVPRYDTKKEPPSVETLTQLGLVGMILNLCDDAMDNLTAESKTYVHDVCVRCGRTLDRA